MTRNNKILLTVGLFLCLILPVGCSSPPPTTEPSPTPPPTLAEPTPDVNAVRTEAAVTVWAQVTQTLAAQPTDTAEPSPTVTATLPAGFTPVTVVSGTPVINPEGTPGTPGAAPTVTLDPAIVNRAQWVSQSIADGTVLAPGETFTMTWQLKNIGAVPWTAEYVLRFYTGNTFGAPQEILLGKVVAPTELVEVSVPMKAPTQPGDYRTDWVLSTENRINFKDPVFLKISVGQTATPSATVSPTLTATSTP